ncbi:hypothetical protein [Rhizobium sp. P28RR-XV]|uniref:hypothetical protein n=1 Tax=Rhizobium sp. P28RR-XV TaxID=2726737 RepID=UPI00197D080B|nr:hypothetical protein [Rhizobium sp. P28RR-XV]
MRRFHLTMLTCALAISSVIPFIQDLSLLLGLRLVRGMVAGALIPVLMMACATLPASFNQALRPRALRIDGNLLTKHCVMAGSVLR